MFIKEYYLKIHSRVVNREAYFLKPEQKPYKCIRFPTMVLINNYKNNSLLMQINYIAFFLELLSYK